MPDELYLIAHKVRGEAAFDIAMKIEAATDTTEGFWWVIPTSGHRAFPFNWIPLSELTPNDTDGADEFLLKIPMPEDLRDHYRAVDQYKRKPTVSTPEAKASAEALLKELGI